MGKALQENVLVTIIFLMVDCIAVGKQNWHFDQHLTGSKERTHSMVKLMTSLAIFFIVGVKIFIMVFLLKSDITSCISCPHPPENDIKLTFLLIYFFINLLFLLIYFCINIYIVTLIKKCLDLKPDEFFSWLLFKVTVDLQRPNFANFFFFVPDIAKISI